jgi:hypothetical protein
MKFLNVLVATTAVFANSDPYCYYSPDIISQVEGAVGGVVGGVLGVVGAVTGTVIAGVSLSVSVLAQIKNTAKNNCVYGNYYGQNCYRCTQALGPLPQLSINADVNVNAAVAVGAH